MDEEWVEYDGGAVQDWHRSANRIRVAPDVAVIPERAFRDCGDLRAVDLSNVTTISDFAFYNCGSLQHVVWSTASAVEIGEGAFGACSSLSEIDLSNVTVIGREAFGICESLTHVTIPSSVTSIEPAAFFYCTNLTEVELGEGMQRIGRDAFRDCSNLIRINIPPSVTEIDGGYWDGDGAFSYCRSLVEVELREGLQKIGQRAFHGCKSLGSIKIPSTTLEVGNNAFAGCHQLTRAELQEGLQMIGSDAFMFCRSLERIAIPSSTTSVGSKAFWYCGNLSEVTLREGVHCIESEAFEGCPSLRHINIPPVAFVIDIEGSSCQLMRGTMPKPNWRKLVVSKWLQYRSPDELEQAEAKVNEILGRYQESLALKSRCIRKWFYYYYLVDVATMLELAIWRVNMDGNEQDAEARQAIRENCGNDMNVIIPCVLQFCSL